MTDQGGYGKPPRGRRWEKGESGNKDGRPPKSIPTWAEIIENEWKKSVILANGGQTAALELILLHLWDRVKDGNREAARVLRKYETVFRRKLLLAYENDTGQSTTPDGRHRRHRPGPDTPLSEKEKKYRGWQNEFNDAYPRDGRLDLIPWKEAAKLLRIMKREPERPTSRDIWRRRKPKDLEDTEIFHQVLNSPVVVKEGGRRKRLPMMGGLITKLVADAARGKVNSAEVLIDLHRDSTKNGDYGVPKRPGK